MTSHLREWRSLTEWWPADDQPFISIIKCFIHLPSHFREFGSGKNVLQPMYNTFCSLKLFTFKVIQCNFSLSSPPIQIVVIEYLQSWSNLKSSFNKAIGKVGSQTYDFSLLLTTAFYKKLSAPYWLVWLVFHVSVSAVSTHDMVVASWWIPLVIDSLVHSTCWPHGQPIGG